MGDALRRPRARAAARVSPGALLAALRPRQWTKNGLLFIALAFTLNLQQPVLLARTVLAFVAFCALSSAGYLLNDVLDVEADRQHPAKRHRPIAAGSVSVGLAGGFVLRAAAGAVAIDVPISPWLYIATLLGALLIALGKRRNELQTLGFEAAAGHRRNLESYSLEFVDQLILVVSSAALMTYALYTFSAENLPRDHSMMVTIPVVLYGLFRYLFLIRQGDLGGAPEDLLFRDRPLLVAVVLWAVLAVTTLYFGR